MTVVAHPISIHRYIGASTDTKPTIAATQSMAPPTIGSTFYERDTGLLYITYDGTNWVVKDQVSKLVTVTGDALTDDTLDAIQVVKKDNIVNYITSEDSSPAAIALTANPGVAFRLLRVELLLSAAPTTSESFTITLDAGDGTLHDVVLLTRDLSVGSVTSLCAIFGKGYEFEADDEIDIAYLNTDDGNYGCRIVVEKI